MKFNFKINNDIDKINKVFTIDKIYNNANRNISTSLDCL